MGHVACMSDGIPLSYSCWRFSIVLGLLATTQGCQGGSCCLSDSGGCWWCDIFFYLIAGNICSLYLRFDLSSRSGLIVVSTHSIGSIRVGHWLDGFESAIIGTLALSGGMWSAVA